LCTLGLSVESRDPYTEGHCERLAENASNLGRHLHLHDDEITPFAAAGISTIWARSPFLMRF
jgi:HD-GYP domain-containing protein (c-di-GMP phosphodiesterase class II)